MAVAQSSNLSAGGRQYHSSWWRRNQRKIAPYIFIAPFFILFAVFGVYPILYSLWLSFFKGFGFDHKVFYGLGNYIHMFQDPRYIKAVGVTTLYALFSVFILAPLALLAALAVNSAYVRWKGIFKIGLFFPTITSAVVVTVIFARVLDTNYGLLNAFLGWFHIPPIGWLSDTHAALPSFMLMGVWNYIGINMLFWLAGLNSIDSTLGEAAAIDGANKIQTFFRVTLPQLRPIMLFVVIQAIIGSYNVFAQPLLLTNGGPSDSTLFISLYVYVQGFQNFNVGYASAIAYSMTALLLVLSLLNIKIFGLRGADD